jgi:hypothetical protein
MSCPKCEYYRKKLSPHEDADFTADYLLVEPREYLRSCIAFRKNSTDKILLVHASEVFYAAFNFHPDVADVTKMGRTLKALGWEATKRDGYTMYALPLEEFEDANPC